MNRREFIKGVLAGSALLGLGVEGFVLEPSNVKESYHQIETDKLEEKLRIVHLSDLHLDNDTRRDYVPQMVNNREPDLILMTGDYLNYKGGTPDLKRIEEFVNKLSAKKGIYACFGNWDEGIEDKIFKDTDIIPLRNQTVNVDSTKINIVGLDFMWGNFPGFMLQRILGNLNDEEYNILLSHSPDLIKEVSQYDLDLYLAGHTHGGQVRIPFLGLLKGKEGEFPYDEAIYIPSKHGTKYSQGLFEEGRTKMYVNRGIGLQGNGLPIRLLCPPEIATFDIGPKEKLPTQNYVFPSNM